MTAPRLRARLTRTFARHNAEMVVVMLVGMGLLALPVAWVASVLWPSVDLDDPTPMLAQMAVTMTLPMVPWMRWRGHGWRPALEMAGAMLLPGLGAIALYEGGVVTAVWLLMTIEHVAMLGAMLAVMIARPDEYSGGSGHAHAPRPAAAPVPGAPR